jgi:hypothetical protein
MYVSSFSNMSLKADLERGPEGLDSSLDWLLCRPDELARVLAVPRLRPPRTGHRIGQSLGSLGCGRKNEAASHPMILPPSACH